MKSNAPMRRLGNYIRQVDVRNRDLELTTVQGINIGKYFFPSVANLIGTDLSKYKLVLPDQFACNFMHVGRDEKIPVARNNTSEALLVSSAYYTFKVFDEAIMPEYLELVFKNPNFDREAWFHTDADVRSGLGWEDFCDLQIPVPHIEEQREIVARHKAIEHKIDVNRRLIAKLEETARTIYRHTFVENIDPENLPDGWKLSPLYDIAEYLNGLACQNFETDSENSWDVLKIRELRQGYTDDSSDKADKTIPEKYIVSKGDIVFAWSASLMVKIWYNKDVALNQHLFKVIPYEMPKWFVLFTIQNQIDSWTQMISAKATSMGHIKIEDLKEVQVNIPPLEVLKTIDGKIQKIFSFIENLNYEIIKLSSL